MVVLGQRFTHSFFVSETFERLRSSKYTPSVSHLLDSSLREGAGDGGAVPFIGVLAKIRGYGRFSSPLRNSDDFGLYHSTDDTPSVSPCGLPAPSEREPGMAGAIHRGAR